MEKTNMTKVRGLYSSKDNPLAQPSRTSSKCGPSSNPDAMKANRLMQKAHAEKESLRGKSGM